MLTLNLKKDYDYSKLGTGSLRLGYEQLRFLFNAGAFPRSGDCLIVEAGGDIRTINSNDLIHDMEAYTITERDE